MTKEEREGKKLFRKYDDEFGRRLEKFVIESMEYGGLVDFEVKAYVMAKILCNGLVCHLNTVFRGDTSKVAEFISRGINIDLNTARKLNKKR